MGWDVTAQEIKVAFVTANPLLDEHWMKVLVHIHNENLQWPCPTLGSQALSSWLDHPPAVLRPPNNYTKSLPTDEHTFSPCDLFSIIISTAQQEF